MTIYDAIIHMTSPPNYLAIVKKTLGFLYQPLVKYFIERSEDKGSKQKKEFYDQRFS
jgi:hypothetical protein